MALQVKSITQQLSRLSVGIRPSLRAASTITKTPATRHHLTTEPKRTVATSSATAPPPAALSRKPTPKKAGSQKPDVTGQSTEWPHGHGDRIWFSHHILDGLRVFSLKRQVTASKKLRTLPFNGKKLKPSKFRKDYWEPYAMIEFPAGHGHVGLSVYHMLREASFLHDHAWDHNQDSITKCPDTNRTLDRIERGRSLNRHMMPNSVADMAGVLGGLGKGNKIWAARPTDDAPAGVRVPATVYWANIAYKEYASEWPENVTHIDAAEWLGIQAEQQVEGEPAPMSTKEMREELAQL